MLEHSSWDILSCIYVDARLVPKTQSPQQRLRYPGIRQPRIPEYLYLQSLRVLRGELMSERAFQPQGSQNASYRWTR